MKKQRNMQIDAPLRLGEYMGFMLSGMGYNFFVMIISTFLMVYYTNVIGVSAAVVGSIIGISKIFDGISDMVAGYLIDHTKSKAGKCRPWFIRMILPMCVSVFLMFWVPAE